MRSKLALILAFALVPFAGFPSLTAAGCPCEIQSQAESGCCGGVADLQSPCMCCHVESPVQGRQEPRAQGPQNLCQKSLCQTAAGTIFPASWLPDPDPSANWPFAYTGGSGEAGKSPPAFLLARSFIC